jgi:tellurite resistance protein
MLDIAPLSQDLARPELEAMFEAIFLAAFADDDFSDAERERFATRVSELSGGFVVEQRFNELLALVTRELFTHGLSQRLATLAERLPSERLRQVTLQSAADVASQDELGAREKKLLEQLGDALGLEPDFVLATLREQSPPSGV